MKKIQKVGQLSGVDEFFINSSFACFANVKKINFVLTHPKINIPIYSIFHMKNK